MANKKKDRGKTKSLDELIQKRPKQELTKRTRPRNNFPFVPARPDRPNPFGLNLSKEDCRIANGAQKYGFSSVTEFCRLVKISTPKFYERLRNPDLIKALKLLALGSRVLGYPKAMDTLTENFNKSPKWAELYMRANGLWDEPERPYTEKEDTERPLITADQVRLLIEGAKR